MKILQAFKFQLRPNDDQAHKMRQSAGHCRYVWNHACAIEKKLHDAYMPLLNYKDLCAMLIEWKNDAKSAFLKEVHSQILQQSLKDMDRALQNFFAKRASFPKLKKKGIHDSFRYPQGFKIEEGNSRVYLPKIGWMRYRNSRKIQGKPKQITVSQHAQKWSVSIQTERDIADPVHPSQSVIGIDLGVKNFATLSDGTFINPVSALRKHEKKLKRIQRRRAKCTKRSRNWKKYTLVLQRLHEKIANIRRDFLHKATTDISKNHAVVILEDLRVQNMSRSASGTKENPGKNVRAKSGLNKAILDQGWYEFRRQLEYKLHWRGGQLISVPPQYTSQRCSHCGFVAKENRLTQADFRCTACGFETNADYNAALNILVAGYATSACGAERAHASVLKQEPASDS